MQNYQLIWSDEFSDSTINTSNWTHETRESGWGNIELEYYTNRSINPYIQNGSLVIEARIKLPYGKGIWPAFWMLGENISTVGWPACGEINIMELIGGGVNDKKVYGTAYWESEVHAQYGGSYTLSYGIFADNYHVSSITLVLDKFELLRNRPNPFSPSTKIKYTIPSVETSVGTSLMKFLQFVQLKVYDILGNEVATLVDKYRLAGNYEVEFSAEGGSVSGGDAYNLPSGVYLYRLQVGNLISTKKMILLR